MTAPAAALAVSRAAARDLRRLRILAGLEAGLSYAAIGRAEGLSRERVRQIVAKALDQAGRDQPRPRAGAARQARAGAAARRGRRR